jgi:hypothetical protein
MVALPPFRLTGGVFTTPMEATANDFVDTHNLHSVNGVIQKRQGSTAVGQYGDAATAIFVGWGASSTRTEPATTYGASASMGSTGNRDLYVGSTNGKFYQFNVYGTAISTFSSWAGMINGEWSSLRDKVDYWNGTAWVAVSVADMFRQFGDGASPQIMALNMYRPWASDSSSNPSVSGFHVRGLINPPSDWASKSVGGNSGWWLRVRDMPSGLAASTLAMGSGGGYPTMVTTQEHTVLDMLYFNDRRGTRHEFITYLSSPTEVRYVLDGVTLLPSDDIQPDGTSQMFSATTRTWSYYDASTDRVIGYVDGVGWFYVVLPNDGGIYGLQASITPGPPYESVTGGLRSTIPDGRVAVAHADRIFTANGVVVAYSSPGTYKDVWPNDNEFACQDEYGNITGMCSVGGVLAVFKRNAIWVAQSDGSADGYVAFPLPGNVGCIAPRSIAVAGGIAWFLAEDGIYTFNGERVEKKSRRIDGLLQKELGSSDATRSIGVYHTVMNQYRLYYPSQTSLPWVMSDAIYCSVDPDGDVSFWPQGKNFATDPGFNATCIVSDSSAPVNRIMLGDRYGCVWQMDSGLYDQWAPVTFWGVTHRVKIGDVQKMLVRWITPTTKTWNNLSWTCNLIVDGNVGDKQALTFGDDGENPSAAFHATATVESNALRYANFFDMQTVRGGSVQGLGRFCQLEISDSVPQRWELNAVEMDVNRFGRRG